MAISGTAGAVTVNGGTLIPGSASAIGIANTGALTFANGGTFSLAINPSALTSSTDIASGNLTLGFSLPTLSLTDLGGNATLPADTSFSLITYSGTWDGGLFSFGGTPIANGGMLTFGANTFYLNCTGGTGNNSVMLTTVPEPATCTSLLDGLGKLTAMLRFRRRRAQEWLVYFTWA